MIINSNDADEPTLTVPCNLHVAGMMNLDLKVMLEGPFNGTAMNPTLNSSGLLPLSQPYNSAPWNYGGTESVAGIPNSDIVDWILVELRDAPGGGSTATSSTIIGQKACFIKSDGTITETDGISLPEFELTIANNLFVVIWHRNHLGIMSSVPLIRIGNTFTYDFTIASDQTYGNNAQKELIPGTWGMFTADGNADATIDDLDKLNNWIEEAGLSGYYSGDYNLDNQVNNIDKDAYWLNNTGTNCFVPE